MRFVSAVLLVLLAACSDPLAPPPELGQSTVLIYNLGDQVAHVTARGGDLDFQAVTLGDVAPVTSACFAIAAGPLIMLEARVGAYHVRSNTIRFKADARYVWTIGDPDVVPEGPPCEPSKIAAGSSPQVYSVEES